MTYQEDKEFFLEEFNIRIDDSLDEVVGRQLMDLVYAIRDLNDPDSEISNVFFFINQESRSATVLTTGNDGSQYIFDDGIIEFDFAGNSSLLFVDPSGTLRSPSSIQIMAHELWHAAYTTGDPEQLFTADPDYVGGAVTFENYVAGILGDPERLTYSGAISTSNADFSDFSAGQNLTFGNPIDVALVAWRPNDPFYNRLDTTLNTTKLSDLFIGNNSSQELLAGAGNDFVYGLGGDDKIFGGVGSDFIDGGDHGTDEDSGDTLTYELLTTGAHMSVFTAGDAENPTIYQVADITGGATPQWADKVTNFEIHTLTPKSDLLELSVLPSDIFGVTFDGGGNDNPHNFLIAHYASAGNTVDTLSADMDILSLEGLTPAGSALVVDLGVKNTTNEPADGTLFYESDPTTTITIKNFEGVLGTDGVDKFFGTNGNNALFGFDEADLLVGRGGQDLLVGDGGDDTLYGGFWWSTPGSPPPEVYADDGIRDILLGGADNDTYYVSNNDQVWDMTLEQMATAVAGGPNGSATLASDGNGTVWFNGIQLGEAEWIEPGEDPLDGYPRQSWVDYSGAGATLAVFKDQTSGFVYRVFSAISYVGPEGNQQEVHFYVLGVEDWNSQTVFEIGNAAYDPDTHTLGFPAQPPEQTVATSSLTASTAATVQPVEVDLGDGHLGLISAVADSGGAASRNDGLSSALAGLTAGESGGGAPEHSGGSQGIAASSDAWQRQGDAGAPAASSVLASDTAETLTVAAAGAGSPTTSYLGITFYEPDPIDGTTGDDNVMLTNGDDSYDAGPGNDTIKGRNGNDLLIGGSGNDLLDGGGGDDVLEGGTGSDELKGGTGSDTADYGTLNEGVRADLTAGTARANGQFLTWQDSFTAIENLTGSTFSDVLIGDAGNNVLTGRAGHDQLKGMGGSDTFDGGLGQDTVYFDWITSGPAAVIDLAAGTYGGAAAGNTYISIESFYGTNIATAGDTLLGDDNKNYFFGQAGNDTLDGRGGGDVLMGGTGADVLTGGAGVDWFLYTAASDSSGAAGTRDLITDFTSGEDYIDLSFMDANVLAAGNQAFNFVGTNAFSGAAGTLRYQHVSGNTLLMADISGNNAIDFMIELVGLHDLTIYDFGAGSVLPFWAGTAGDDTIQAGPGDDTIAGGFGDDVLLGGAGNDAIFGNDGADQLFGEDGDDILGGDAGPDLLDGGAGTDEATYYGSLAGITVNLADPSANTGDGVGDVYVSIENLRGSLFDDVLYGDGGANVIWGHDGADSLYGGGGSDTLYGDAGNDDLDGGAGADVLDGGAGEDRVSYASAASGVIADLATGGTGGDAAGDSYVSIEWLWGSAYDDQLFGDDADNWFYGGAGADYIDGRGGAGRLTFYFAAGAVSVDLGLGIGLAGEAAGDTYVNIDRVVGSQFDDTFIGGAEFDEFFGSGGDDTFRPGGGNDLVSGQGGSDTLDLSWASQGTSASLTSTLPYDFYGTIFQLNYAQLGADTIYLELMENIIGTNFADYIRGSSGQNWLTGEGGNDELHGEAGDDTLEGGAGSDALYGEAGNDLFVPGPGNDLIVGGNDWDLIDYLTSDAGVYLTYSDTTPYLHSDGVTYDLNYAIIGGTETDYIQVTEYARGSDFDDTLIGSNGFNWLAGMGGDDTIEGRGGIDYLYGGTGNDTLKGGAADDDLFGWTGNDTLLGEAGMDELYGEAGDDSLWGGTNTDTFVFAIGAGNDTVEDFQDNYDVLRFTGGLTFLDLTITDDVGGALISYGASDSVLVMNMAAANLTEADMAFV